jgi:hypothetical protein
MLTMASVSTWPDESDIVPEIVSEIKGIEKTPMMKINIIVRFDVIESMPTPVFGGTTGASIFFSKECPIF